MKLQHISFTVPLELIFPSERVWVFFSALIELRSDGKLTDEENYSCMVSSQSSCLKRMGTTLQASQLDL